MGLSDFHFGRMSFLTSPVQLTGALQVFWSSGLLPNESFVVPRQFPIYLLELFNSCTISVYVLLEMPCRFFVMGRVDDDTQSKCLSQYGFECNLLVLVCH